MKLKFRFVAVKRSALLLNGWQIGGRFNAANVLLYEVPTYYDKAQLEH